MKGHVNMQVKFKPILNKVNKKVNLEKVKQYSDKTMGLVAVISAKMREYMDFAASKLVKIGMPANVVSILGFFIGLLAINFISMQMYVWGLVLILVNRLFDGLDGAIARKTKITDYGVFLDAVLDYVFYAGVIFAFALANPSQNAVAAAFLLFAFMSSAAALLAYGVVAHKSNQNYELLNNSPFYLGGVAQGFETLLALVLMCILPWWFMQIAIIFGVLGFVKALTIVVAAYYNFVIASKKSGISDINE